MKYMSVKKMKQLKRQNQMLIKRLEYKNDWIEIFKQMSDEHIRCIRDKDNVIADYKNNRFRISIGDLSYKDLYNKTKMELDDMKNRNLIRRILNL